MTETAFLNAFPLIDSVNKTLGADAAIIEAEGGVAVPPLKDYLRLFPEIINAVAGQEKPVSPRAFTILLESPIKAHLSRMNVAQINSLNNQLTGALEYKADISKYDHQESDPLLIQQLTDMQGLVQQEREARYESLKSMDESRPLHEQLNCVDFFEFYRNKEIIVEGSHFLDALSHYMTNAELDDIYRIFYRYNISDMLIGVMKQNPDDTSIINAHNAFSLEAISDKFDLMSIVAGESGGESERNRNEDSYRHVIQVYKQIELVYNLVMARKESAPQ